MLKTLDGLSTEQKSDYGMVKEKVRAELKRLIQKTTGRRPMIMPVILESEQRRQEWAASGIATALCRPRRPRFEAAGDFRELRRQRISKRFVSRRPIC